MRTTSPLRASRPSSARARAGATAGPVETANGTDNSHVAMADIGAELRAVCAASVSALLQDHDTEFSHTTTDDCFAPTRCVAPLALIVNEAVSNAVKWAHPSGVPGKINLDCRRNAKGAIEIEIADDGVGLPEGLDPAEDGGRGLRLMHKLSRQLGATLTFESTSLGLRVRLRLPPHARSANGAAIKAGSQVDEASIGSSKTAAERLVQDLLNDRKTSAALKDDTHWRMVFQALPAAIYITDAAGRITFFNEAAAELWGCRPELGKSEFCGSWKLYWPDGTPLPHDECPMAVTLRERRPVRGMEAIAERPDGSRILFIPYPTPLIDASGKLVGAVNMLVDVSDRRQQAHQYASIIESSNDAIVSKDLDGIVKTWNHGAEQLFGYKAEEIIGKPVTMLLPAEQLDEEPKIIGRIQNGERVEHYETVRRRKDGTLLDISLTVSPIKDGVGRVIGASKIARDITERKRSQEQRELLLNEMKHRVKNTLATVQALAGHTMRSASEGERASFVARLHALGKAYDLLTSETWDRAPLRDIVTRAVEPFQATRFRIEGRDVWLDANKSLHLTMALHELATNAVKYGALSNESGRVDVAWQVLDGDRLKLTWRETGGPPVTPPNRKGFGSMLIEQSLDCALLEFAPPGVACTLDFAL